MEWNGEVARLQRGYLEPLPPMAKEIKNNGGFGARPQYRRSFRAPQCGRLLRCAWRARLDKRWEKDGLFLSQLVDRPVSRHCF